MEEYRLDDGLEPLAARSVIGNPLGMALHVIFKCNCGESVMLTKVGMYIMCQCGRAYALNMKLLVADPGDIAMTTEDLAQYWLDTARDITHAKKEERGTGAS